MTTATAAWHWKQINFQIQASIYYINNIYLSGGIIMDNQKNKKAGILSYIASPLMTVLLMSIASIVFFLLFHDISTVIFFIIIMIVDVSCKIVFILLPVKSKVIARYTSLILFGLLLL